MDDQYIITASGKRFYLNDPKPEQVCIEDIAHALSVMPRFAGHTKQFYSVAQHCVEVSKLVERMTVSACRGDALTGMVDARKTEVRVSHAALRGLLHDAHEAYVGDMSTPLKSMLPAYKEIEGKAESAVFMAFLHNTAIQQAPAHIREMCAAVKRADLIMLATERRDLMPKTSDRWAVLDGVEPRKEFVSALGPTKAKALFLDRFKVLTTTVVMKPETTPGVEHGRLLFAHFTNPLLGKPFREKYESEWGDLSPPRAAATARQYGKTAAMIEKAVSDATFLARTDNFKLRAENERLASEKAMAQVMLKHVTTLRDMAIKLSVKKSRDLEELETRYRAACNEGADHAYNNGVQAAILAIFEGAVFTATYAEKLNSLFKRDDKGVVL